MSLMSTASSTRASARSVSTLKKPGPVANVRTSVPPRCTRVEPALSVATSGACRARTPISPAAPGTTSISASPSNADPSGVTSETENFGCPSAMALGRDLRRGPGRLVGLLDRLLDAADHVERGLGELVMVAGDDLLEAADRVLQLHVRACGAGEHLGHV